VGRSLLGLENYLSKTASGLKPVDGVPLKLRQHYKKVHNDRVHPSLVSAKLPMKFSMTSEGYLL
jgi:hypothetical protein